MHKDCNPYGLLLNFKIQRKNFNHILLVQSRTKHFFEFFFYFFPRVIICHILTWSSFLFLCSIYFLFQSGVAEVVYFVEKRLNNPDITYIASHKLLSMAGVKVCLFQFLNSYFILLILLELS